MKILAFSDVAKWKGYEELVDRIQPDIVALAGDLTAASFESEMQNEALKKIPGCKQLLTKYGIRKASERLGNARRFGTMTIGGGHYYSTKRNGVLNFLHELDYLTNKHRMGRTLTKFRKRRERTHVNGFYRFLAYAGKRSQVLVVKGNHDDVEEYYAAGRIERINGCREISGKVVKIRGLRYLGVGFEQTNSSKTLKSIIEEWKHKVDVVITHCQQSRMPLVASLEPRLIIRGHFGTGRYLVNGVPSVFTEGVHFTVIELGTEIELPRMRQYVISADRRLVELRDSSRRCLVGSEFERYRWLRRYPQKSL